MSQRRNRLGLRRLAHGAGVCLDAGLLAGRGSRHCSAVPAVAGSAWVITCPVRIQFVNRICASCCNFRSAGRSRIPSVKRIGFSFGRRKYTVLSTDSNRLVVQKISVDARV